MRTLLTVTVVLAWSPGVRAEVNRCGSGEADVAFTATDLTEHSGDTGWFPSGSPAQLRLTGRIAGETTVAMGLSPTACWSNGLLVGAPAQKATGMFEIAYGAELHLFAHIHTSILGLNIDWNHELPIPYVPEDLLLGGTTTFDPIVLPDSLINAVHIHDTTSQIEVFSTDLIGAVINITGISGNLAVTVQGQMTATYTTSAVSLGSGKITSALGTAALAAPEGGYGVTLPVTVGATGNIRYAPSLIFAAEANVRIFGIKVATYTIASVTMPLPVIGRPITLAGSGATINLPHLTAVPEQLGFADGARQSLQLHNSGKAPLMLETASAPSGVTAASVTIAPGADGTVEVVAADSGSLGGAPLVLATNDPNHPSISVALSPSSSGQAGEDANGSSAGCNAAGGSSGAIVLVAFGLISVVSRRRGRRSPATS